MRSIIFDTETTGLNRSGSPEIGHRVIEIGAVELVDGRLTGRHYHQYLNPEMAIDPEAAKVHGIRDEDVRMMPTFTQIFDEFWAFFGEADVLIAHNIQFDRAFLNQELALDGQAIVLEERFKLIDTLEMARKRGYRPANLDALCKRFNIDLSQRTVHGALLDARLLAEVYLKMTQVQQNLQLQNPRQQQLEHVALPQDGWLAIRCTADELAAHEALLKAFNKEA